MQERRIDFKLFHREFSFYSDAPDKEIEQVITLLKKEFSAQDGAASHTPSTTRLVFGCLRMAARLVQERGKHQALLVEQQRTVDAIIDKIVSQLD